MMRNSSKKRPKAQPPRKAKKLSAPLSKPDVRLLLSQCYSSIGRYDDAVKLLNDYPAAPPAPAPNASEDDKKRRHAWMTCDASQEATKE